MRLKINTPADLAAVVPLILGFHPEDSLVMLCLGDQSTQSGPHLRIEHPHTPEDLIEIARVLGQIAAQHGSPTTTWAVVSYTEDQNDARDALLTLAAMLTGSTGQVVALLQVTGTPSTSTGASETADKTTGEGQQWISHDDLLDPESDPQGGRDLRAAGIITGPHGRVTRADLDRYTVQGVAEGIPAAAASREEVGLHLTPSPSDAAQQQVIRDLIAAVRGQRLAQRLDATPEADVATRAFRTEESAWLAEQVERARTVYAAGSRDRLSDEDLARIVVDLVDPVLRDVVTGSLSRAEARVEHALWADVARRAPAEHATLPLIYAGLTAWLSGSGALAWVAYDRAKEQAPSAVGDSGLAGLLRDLLERAIPPHTWDEWARRLRAAAERASRPDQADPADQAGQHGQHGDD